MDRLPERGEAWATEEDSFRELLRAAQTGSREATGELIERFRPYLLLIANQDLGVETQQKVAASDIVQDAMLSAQLAIDQFRGETVDELRGWLRQIVLNDILETERRYHGTAKRKVRREVALADQQSGHRPVAELTSPETTPTSRMMIREEAEALHRAMNRLSPEYRTVIELRNWQDLSFAEIGQRMNRSAEAARKLWSRAVLQLQQNLDQHE